MNDFKIDPIQYAWLSCNRGVSFPAVLRMKTNGADPLRARLGEAQSLAIAAGQDGVQAAVSSPAIEP
jgi:hypothetical protein